MHTFIQALLDFNPDLGVTVITGRPYLYDHSRLTVQSIADENKLDETLNQNYAVIIDHYDTAQRYSDQLESKIRSSFNLESRNASPRLVTDKLKGKKEQFMYIRSSKSNDSFIFERVNVDGVDYAGSLGLNRVQAENVYDPVFRLLAELGIPFKIGKENNTPNSLTVGVPYDEAERKWIEMMKLIGNFDFQRGKTIRPVVIINPFGGENERKGYSRASREVQELRDHMHVLIASGLKIVILPNGQQWGTREVAQELINGMDLRDQQSVVVGPLPQEDPRFFKYFLSYADYLITVEGGMMHLGYIVGKSLGVVLKPGAGPAKWIPLGTSENQGIVSGADAAARKYREMNERRTKVDGAMLSLDTVRDEGIASSPAQQNPGGIDFNLDLLELEIQGQGSSFNLPDVDQNFEHIHINDGLMPVIINIAPLTNLPLILGAAERQDGSQFSLAR
jgi:hypothetical protein